MVAKLGWVTEHYLEIKVRASAETRDDNMAKMAGGCCRIIEQWF